MFSPLCITEADGLGPTLQSGGNQLIGLREIDMVQKPLLSPHSPSVSLCNYPIDWPVLIAFSLLQLSATRYHGSWVQGVTSEE